VLCCTPQGQQGVFGGHSQLRGLEGIRELSLELHTQQQAPWAAQQRSVTPQHHCCLCLSQHMCAALQYYLYSSVAIAGLPVGGTALVCSLNECCGCNKAKGMACG